MAASKVATTTAATGAKSARMTRRPPATTTREVKEGMGFRNSERGLSRWPLLTISHRHPST
jgi:hypothetical protein